MFSAKKVSISLIFNLGICAFGMFPGNPDSNAKRCSHNRARSCNSVRGCNRAKGCNSDRGPNGFNAPNLNRGDNIRPFNTGSC